MPCRHVRHSILVHRMPKSTHYTINVTVKATDYVSRLSSIALQASSDMVPRSAFALSHEILATAVEIENINNSVWSTH